MAAIVAVILLIVYFQIYSNADTSEFDSTALLLTGMFGTLIALAVFMAIVRTIL